MLLKKEEKMTEKKLETVVVVSRQYCPSRFNKEDAMEDEVRTVEVHTFANVPTAQVSITGGLTKSLGDYNSAKVSVTVSLPTYVEELDDAFKVAGDKLDEFLSPSLEEFVDMLKERKLIK